MDDLDTDLTKIERELSKLQASVDESKRMSARDSGFPESRRQTLDDEHYKVMGAKPKSVRMTTLPAELSDSRKPASNISLDELDDSAPDRISLTSTPYFRDRQDNPLQTEANITTRRSRTNIDHHKGSHVKPDKFDGTASWLDFKSHFDVCAELNGWSTAEKGMHLAVSLRGRAQAVLGSLPDGEKCNYRLLCRSLEERFLPPNQTELYRAQLRERRQRASDALPELGQDICRLANLAYPTAPMEVRETLAKEQFIDALKDSDMRLRIKQARPIDLNDAIRHAVELDAFNSAERRLLEDKGYLRVANQPNEADKNTVATLLKVVRDLQEEMKSIKMAVQNSKSSKRTLSSIVCNYCKKKGHVKKNCFAYQNMQKKSGSKERDESTIQGKDKDASRTGVSRKAGEAGIFVNATMNGSKVKLLIDTGATVSII